MDLRCFFVVCLTFLRISTLSIVHHFFFCCCGAPRDLPSFPTRRSSDLGHRFLRSGRCRPSFRGRRAHARRPRSEEHTSELQSHSDLVCRLLLEKKKKKAN